MNITILLPLIFKEMESPHWALAYDPYVVNAFKLYIYCRRGEHRAYRNYHEYCYRVNDIHNTGSSIGNITWLDNVPDGVHIHSFPFEDADPKCIHKDDLRAIRERKNHGIINDIYNVLIYNMTTDVRSWLRSLEPFIKESWIEYEKLFKRLSDALIKDGYAPFPHAHDNPREYLTKHWLRSLINDSFTTPYHMELSTKHYHDDLPPLDLKPCTTHVYRMW